VDQDLEVIKKSASSSLVKALENIIDMQECLQSKSSLKSQQISEESAWKQKLDHCITEKNIKDATKVFKDISNRIELQPSVELLDSYSNLLALLLSDKQCFSVAFDVLLQLEDMYQIIEHEVIEMEQKYKHQRKILLSKFLKALGDIQLKHITSNKFTRIVNELFNMVHGMSEPFEQHLYFPRLMKSLLNLKSRPFKIQKIEQEVWEASLSSLKRNAKEISKENDILQNYGSLLPLSTYRKQQDLPFSFLLKILVKMGHNPPPHIVLNILHNDFPYNHLFSTRDLVSSVITLQNRKMETELDYEIDMGTLEHLCGILARKGSSSDVVSIMEYVDSIRQSGNAEYKPTEGLYESLAQSFASSSKKEDHLLFGVLAIMEADGFKPSFSLIRDLAQAVRSRSTVHRLDNCLHILSSRHDGVPPTTSALNCVMSGYADLGFVEKTYQVFEMFGDLNCDPDINTFILMLEAVYMNLSTALPRSRRDIQIDEEAQEWIDSQINVADTIMEAAREKGFDLDDSAHQLVDVYIRILLSTGGVDKASVYVEDLIADAGTRNELPPISHNTFKVIVQEYKRYDDYANIDFLQKLYQDAGYSRDLDIS
jgi:pentatricopeptide repeat protein